MLRPSEFVRSTGKTRFDPPDLKKIHKKIERFQNEHLKEKKGKLLKEMGTLVKNAIENKKLSKQYGSQLSKFQEYIENKLETDFGMSIENKSPKIKHPS